MLYVTYTLNFVLMIAMPIALGIILTRKLNTPWSLLGWGALAFVASQAARLPLLFGLTQFFKSGVLPHIPTPYANAFNIVILSLTAGLFEEGARYLVYRFALPRAHRWKDALTFGTGHAGVEAVIVGVLVGLSVINMFALQAMDIEALGLNPEQLELLRQQVDAFWATPWPLTLLGAVERAFAMCVHIGLAVMVLQTFTRRKWLWLSGAIGWHALSNIAAVFVAQWAGPLASEGVVGLMALASLSLVWILRPQQEEILAPEALVVLPSTATPRPASPESDLRRKIDDSRFSS